MRVAVTGSTGFIGLHLLRALNDAGEDPVAVVRAASDVRPLPNLNIPVVPAELGDRQTLADAFHDCDAVVHLAGGGLPNQRATWRVNAEGTRSVIWACGQAGVRRLLLASTVTVTRARVAAYGRSKQDAERDVLASALEATVFRFSFIYGPGRTGVFARLVEMVRRLPVVPVVGTGKLDIAPVYVDDIVTTILVWLRRPDVAAGKVYTLAGEPATLDDVIDGVLQQLGLRKRKLHVPAPIALGFSRALSLMPNPPLTRDNVLGMIQGADHDSSLARHELDFDPRPLREGLEATFAKRA